MDLFFLHPYTVVYLHSYL